MRSWISEAKPWSMSKFFKAMARPKISIIIATYNSERLLPLVLASLKKQTLPRSMLEVIVVDGGSADNTLGIARKFKCRIVKNPGKEPVTGKYLGYLSARGKYIIYLDHDEVILRKDSIKKKLEALRKDPAAKAVAGGNYVNPKGYGFINNYINDFGDPFTFFMYRISKRNGFFYKAMKSRFNIVSDEKDYGIFDFSSKSVPIIELAAGASMFDAETLKREHPKTLKDKWLLPHFYYLLRQKHARIIVMKDDPLVHYSAENFRKVLNKISWRVKNNIYFRKSLGKAGFGGRERFDAHIPRYKKYLFLIYSFFVVPVLIDAAALSVSRKDFRYLVHLPLSIFTAASIVYNYALKNLGFRPLLKEYGS